MFDAVIRPACRTKPLPAAGDLPFGAVACGFPSCGSPPTSGHSLRHCCAGRYTAAPAGARAEDAAAQKAAQQKAAQQAASATQKKSNSSTTTTTTTSNTAANTTTSTTTTDSSDDTIDTSQGKYLGRFKLTAYCSCSICCGKWSGGGTASGTTPTPGRTIAMAGVPFGTKLSINGQIYTVEDRGTAYGHVDIFMGSHSQALSFGMKYADVYQVN